MDPEDYWRAGIRDKFVCENCINEDAIRSFITENAEVTHCSYCERQSPIAIGAPLELVIELILESIYSEWQDPRNGVGWSSRDGGWLGVVVINTYDLLWDEFELDIDNEILRNDIIAAIGYDKEWCKTDPYGPSDDQKLSWSWDAFCSIVKHKNRYFFQSTEIGEDESMHGELLNIPYRILQFIANEISELNLIKELDAETNIFRVRLSREGNRFRRAHELGTAKPQDAVFSNRWSPAGIPLFYGSLDVETAILETVDREKLPTTASIGTFVPSKRFSVIDFTTLPAVPSIFDQTNRQRRATIIFLRAFLEDVAKPVKKDKREHIEYVPTQVVAEFFRFVFLPSNRSNITGILYKSARNPEGTCCALFLENDQMADRGEPINEEKPLLVLDGNSLAYRVMY